MAGQLAARESSWVNEYLLGVMAECELPSDQGQLTTAAVRSTVGSIKGPGARDAGDATRLAAERALEHYHRFLELHPDSFWGHYRAAAVAFGLGIARSHRPGGRSPRPLPEAAPGQSDAPSSPGRLSREARSES